MVFGQGLEFDLPKGVVRGVNELREWQIALRGSHPQLAGAPLAGAAASQPMDRLRCSPTVRNGALSCQQAPRELPREQTAADAALIAPRCEHEASLFNGCTTSLNLASGQIRRPYLELPGARQRIVRKVGTLVPVA